MVKTVGAEQSASGAQGHPNSEFRVPSPEVGRVATSDLRVATSESGWQHPRWQHPSSEFRVKKERKKERQRVATSEFRGWQHPSSEFRVKKKERSEGGI